MMEKRQYGLKDDATISVTIHEAGLISNMIYQALLNINSLNDDQRKMAQRFMVKLQKAALSINKQPLD